MLNALEYSAELNSLAFYLDTQSRVSYKALQAAFPELGRYEFDYMNAALDRKQAAADLLDIYVQAEAILGSYLQSVDVWNAAYVDVLVLKAGFVADVEPGFRTKKVYDKTKRKYICMNCGAAVWGKPGLVIGCWDTSKHELSVVMVPAGRR